MGMRKGRVPVLLTGITRGDGGWRAHANWRAADLFQSQKHRDAMLRVGDDDDGNAVRLALSDYLQYMLAQVDDDPLCAQPFPIAVSTRHISAENISMCDADVFEEDFGEICPTMLHEYRVPPG
eukprot:SAG31_NODE_19373_length_604_cov_1.079208_1_plen_122_part_01